MRELPPVEKGDKLVSGKDLGFFHIDKQPNDA